jgi:hypothetical protein
MNKRKRFLPDTRAKYAHLRDMGERRRAAFEAECAEHEQHRAMDREAAERAERGE